jgi:hypothetical protein
MTGELATSIESRVRQAFEQGGVSVTSVEVRHFPGEQIVVVEVASEYDRALRIAGELDLQVPNGFVTIRRVQGNALASLRKPVSAVDDIRVTSLIELLNARSRTSEAQPSLRYIEGAAQRLGVAMTARHHLIFGRRGVGKTALMLEAKRRLESNGAHTFWANVHPLRGLGYAKAFLTIAHRLCDVPTIVFTGRGSQPQSVARAARLQDRIESLLDAEVKPIDMSALVPQLQQLFSIFAVETQSPLFLFVDDVHYLPIQDVPFFLDLLHGLSRDNPVWLKVAGVKHQMRWFSNENQLGLQAGHDADPLELDITLEEPIRARQFLEDVLKGYVEECDASPLNGFLSPSALDRLVLASGGVPRDFLTLCASAIDITRSRTNARQTGVQDVNQAAGRAAQVKLRELEGDAAASLGTAEIVVEALSRTRRFLLTDNSVTFMRIDLHDKETYSREYDLIQSLMDLRMLHLIHSSLSAPHEAGNRSEVYLLDLSEYSGARLRQKIAVLDFERGHLVSKRTRSGDQAEVAATSRQLVTILRRGPIFQLSSLSDLLKRTGIGPPGIPNG